MIRSTEAFQGPRKPPNDLREPTFSSTHHEGLEALSGACRGRHFLMGCDPVGADSVGPHLLREEADEGIFLSGIETLLVVIPEDHDAEVSLILAADVSALPGEWAASPDTPSGVDGKVVADVAEGLGTSSKVSAADGLEPLPSGRHRGIGKRGHPVMVAGHAVDRGHAVHAGRDRCALGPGRTGDDPGR